MKIAIVGAGVSGLAAAHLLHREPRGHRVRGGRVRRAGTRTRSASTPTHATHHVDTGFIVFNDRNYPNFERLLAGSGVAGAAVGHELRRSPTARRLRVQRRVAERPVRQARAPRDAVVPPHGRRPRALQPRGARRCCAARRRTRRSAHWLERAALLARVRRAADRAAGVGRLVGRPAPDVDASRRASWSSSSPTTGCSGFARPPAVARRSRGGSRATSTRSIAPVARPPAPATRRSRRSRRHDDHVDGHAARRRARALRRGRARHPLRPGAARCSPTPTDREHEILGAIPYQPNEAVLHTDARAAAAPPPRVGELELPPARRARPACRPSPTT